MTIRVEADVLPVGGLHSVAVVRDCGAREVKRAAISRCHDLHRIRIVDVLRRAADLQRGDVDV